MRKKYPKKLKAKYDKEYRKKNKNRIQKNLKKYREENPWIKIYVNIGQRCTNKSHKSYKYYGQKGIKRLITSNEIKELWFRDKAYLMDRPSINRDDSKGDYCYNNCKFIELSENTRKDKFKNIVQFDKKGNFIKKWNSVSEASKYYKVHISCISLVLTNRRKYIKGFMWRYDYVKF